jgi:hypothetical protein
MIDIVITIKKHWITSLYLKTNACIKSLLGLLYQNVLARKRDPTHSRSEVFHQPNPNHITQVHTCAYWSARRGPLAKDCSLMFAHRTNFWFLMHLKGVINLEWVACVFKKTLEVEKVIFRMYHGYLDSICIY